MTVILNNTFVCILMHIVELICLLAILLLAYRLCVGFGFDKSKKDDNNDEKNC